MSQNSQILCLRYSQTKPIVSFVSYCLFNPLTVCTFETNCPIFVGFSPNQCLNNTLIENAKKKKKKSYFLTSDSFCLIPSHIVCNKWHQFNKSYLPHLFSLQSTTFYQKLPVTLFYTLISMRNAMLKLFFIKKIHSPKAFTNKMICVLPCPPLAKSLLFTPTISSWWHQHQFCGDKSCFFCWGGGGEGARK